MPQQKTTAEDLLFEDLKAAGFDPEREHFFIDSRDWRLDFAWSEIKLAIEVQGAGRHNQLAGQRGDMEKINAAIELGWRVLYYPAASVKTLKRRERIVEQIKRVICGVECPDSAACVLTGE